MNYQSGNTPENTTRMASPVVDVIEGRDSWTIVADMPGVDEKALELSVDNRTLTVQAKSNGGPADGFQALHSEFEPVTYLRKFSLSDGVDVSGVEATMKDGVLRVVLPKSEKLKPRRIPIKVG